MLVKLPIAQWATEDENNTKQKKNINNKQTPTENNKTTTAGIRTPLIKKSLIESSVNTDKHCDDEGDFTHM